MKHSASIIGVCMGLSFLMATCSICDLRRERFVSQDAITEHDFSAQAETSVTMLQ